VNGNKQNELYCFHGIFPASAVCFHNATYIQYNSSNYDFTEEMRKPYMNLLMEQNCV